MPCPPHFPWLDLPNNIWGWVQITSSLLRPNILLRTLFSNTLSQCSSLNVRDQFLHPYKTTGTTMVLYILTFTFLDSRRNQLSLQKKVFE
jgi:hypothetical protein